MCWSFRTVTRPAATRSSSMRSSAPYETPLFSLCCFEGWSGFPLLPRSSLSSGKHLLPLQLWGGLKVDQCLPQTGDSVAVLLRSSCDRNCLSLIGQCPWGDALAIGSLAHRSRIRGPQLLPYHEVVSGPVLLKRGLEGWVCLLGASPAGAGLHSWWRGLWSFCLRTDQ